VSTVSLLLVSAELLTVIVAVPITKFVELVAVPAGVCTLIGPEVAPAGTVAVICVGEFTAKLAFRPLNLTAVAPVKLRPIIVTCVPANPAAGEKI
jgi:hypothetical protein